MYITLQLFCRAAISIFLLIFLNSRIRNNVHVASCSYTARSCTHICRGKEHIRSSGSKEKRANLIGFLHASYAISPRSWYETRLTTREGEEVGRTRTEEVATRFVSDCAKSMSVHVIGGPRRAVYHEVFFACFAYKRSRNWALGTRQIYCLPPPPPPPQTVSICICVASSRPSVSNLHHATKFKSEKHPVKRVGINHKPLGCQDYGG